MNYVNSIAVLNPGNIFQFNDSYITAYHFDSRKPKINQYDVPEVYGKLFAVRINEQNKFILLEKHLGYNFYIIKFYSFEHNNIFVTAFNVNSYTFLGIVLLA